MWTKDQQNAIELQDKNIIVAASAGSGKTAVLVERVIQKIIKYNIDIDKILVVTFTNAAANELKERLLNAIYKKIDEEPNNYFLKRQIGLISRANITTIDAFCIELVRSNFHILNIDPNFKICSNTESAILKNKVMSNILENEYSVVDSNENANLLYKILEMFGGKDEKLVEILFNIYTYIQSFPYPFEYLKESIEKYNINYETNMDLSDTDFGREILSDIKGNLNILLKQTEKLRTELEEYDDFIKHVELIDDDINLINRCILKVNLWDDLFDTLKNSDLKSNIISRKISNVELKDKVKYFRNKILKKTFDDIKKSIYAPTREILQDNKKAYVYIDYLYKFLYNFDTQYMKLKNEMGLLEFNDIHHIVLDLLYKKNENGIYIETDVANMLKDRYVEVYTDEYQDTDFVQEKILQAVSKGYNRFMVGDIKQSIYRFRQARPEIFNNKYNSYDLINDKNKTEINNAKIVLSENFRSRKQVIDGINYIFERIMSKRLGECSYTDVETLKNGATWYEEEENINYLTKINIIDINKKENQEISQEDEALKEIFELEKYEQEAIYIAREIINLKKDFRVFSNNKFKLIDYKDIVVLLRSIKTKGSILEKTLKNYGIPAYCDNSTNLFDSDEIKLIISFLKILDNPLRDVELVSIMYSIIGKFTLDELAYIKLYKGNKEKNMYESILNILDTYNKEENEIPNSIYTKLNSFIYTIEKFKRYSKIYTISDLLVKIYKETNLYYQFSIDKLSDIKKSNLNILIELAKEYESNFSSSLNLYITYLNNLKETGVGNNESKVLGENEDVVRIMTIHKSKGLEFPVVILSDTTSPYVEKDLNSEIILHQDLGVGVNIVNEDYNITYPSVIKQAIKSISLRQMRSEELRMLYVAMTRAKEKLIIFASLNDYEKYNSNNFLINDGEKIDSAIISNNKSYFKNINMALSSYNKDNKELFDIQVNKLDLNDILEDLNENDNGNEKFLIDDKIKDIKNRIPKEKKNKILNEIDEVYKDVVNNLDYNYIYKDEINTESRVSVSKLKQEYLNSLVDDLQYTTNIVEKNNVINEFKLPSFLEKNIEYTPVRKGILVHFILENLDFSKLWNENDLKEYINKLKNDKVLREEDVNQINIKKIYNFLNSKIGTKLRIAKQIYKEQEFILKDLEISKSTIQGVIDLYYINENNNIVLIDFKTDRIKNENEYIKKYKIQLDIYKKAIEKIIGLKVENVYIYSFELDKEIEVY